MNNARSNTTNKKIIDNKDCKGEVETFVSVLSLIYERVYLKKFFYVFIDKLIKHTIK